MTLHPLSTVDPNEEEPLTLRAQLAREIEASLAPLEEYLDTLRSHEELMARDEAAYVQKFEESFGAETPPTLEQIKAKVEEERAHKARLETEVPGTVLIGTFLLHTSTLRTTIIEKFDRTCDLLMQLIVERGRQAAAAIQEQFKEMCVSRRAPHTQHPRCCISA